MTHAIGASFAVLEFSVQTRACSFFISTDKSSNTNVTLKPPPPRIWFRPFQKSKVQPPPRRGSVGLSERPKVQAPPPGGSVGHSESPRSNPPQRSTRDTPKVERAGKKRLFSEGFTDDFHAFSTRLEVGWTSPKGPRSNTTLQEGRLDHAKGPRSNPPL